MSPGLDGGAPLKLGQQRVVEGAQFDGPRQVPHPQLRLVRFEKFARAQMNCDAFVDRRRERQLIAQHLVHVRPTLHGYRQPHAPGKNSLHDVLRTAIPCELF